MLSINTIAHVVVNTVRAASSSASFDTGLLLAPDNQPDSDERRLQVYHSAAEATAALTEMGFASTSDVYRSAVKYFAASPAPSRLLIFSYAYPASYIDAMDAVLDLTADFYGVMPCGTVTAEVITALAAHIESLSVPLVLFAPNLSYSAAYNSGLDQLYNRQFKRTLPFCCEEVSDCAAVMGTAMGLELSHKGSAFALCYKTIQGIQPADLTQTQVDDIKRKNGNVYLARGYTHFLLENGTMANGQRYDEILYIDKIANDLQNAAVSMLAENTDKMPQTDDSTAQFINRFSSILMNYTGMGVLASAAWRGNDIGPIMFGDIIENGFLMWADSYDDQSDADRAAHRAMPIQVALTLAGSIESIVITVNVQQ